MAIINKPNTLNKVFASSGVKTAPDDTKLAQGWIVQQPPYQQFNFIDNRQDQAIAHINQAGYPVWDSVTSYEANYSWAMGSNGCVYACKVTNTNVNPVTDLSESYWKLILNRDSVITYSQTTAYTRSLLTSGSAAAARTSLGFTTIGSNVGTASTTAAARTAIGMTGVGSTIVTQGSTSAVRTYLGVVSADESTEGLVTRASDAESISGINDTKFLTPKKLRLGFSVSLTQPNGYITFPSWMGGLIIQWARIFVPADSNTTWSYPISFPSATLALQATLAGTFDATDDAGCAIYSGNTNSATVRNGVQAGMNVNCLAIGY